MGGLRVAGFSGGTGLGCECCGTTTSCDCSFFINIVYPTLYATDLLGTYAATWDGPTASWWTCCLSATVSSAIGVNSGILNPCNCSPLSSGSVPYLYQIQTTDAGSSTVCATFKVTRYWPVLWCTSPSPSQYQLAAGDCHLNTCPTALPFFQYAAGNSCPDVQVGTCPFSAIPYRTHDTGVSSVQSLLTSCTPNIAWIGTPANPLVSGCITVPDPVGGSVSVSS